MNVKMKENKVVKSKLTLLKGEGSNIHNLEAEMVVNEYEGISRWGVRGRERWRGKKLAVTKEGLLKHVTPDGRTADHTAIPIKKGIYRMGRQVEFSPFDNSVVNVYD
jgi:hypothetical protein